MKAPHFFEPVRALVVRVLLAFAFLAAFGRGRPPRPDDEPREQGRAPDLAALVALRPWIVERARSRVGALEAEDIAQEVLLRAIVGLPSFNPSRGVLRQWVWGIARTTIIQRRRDLRYQRRFERAFALSLGSTAPDASGPVEARALLRALRDATTADRWEAWYEHAAEGRSVPDIAARTGLPLSTVKWKIHAARTDFAPILAALAEGGAT
jgi:RNA polymerase sigma-70 factor (ECF subfamily)